MPLSPCGESESSIFDKSLKGSIFCLFVCVFVVIKMADTEDKKVDEGQTEPAVFGSCEGPNAMYVKLISSDDHEFIINRDYALTSGTIKAMLSGPGKILEPEPSPQMYNVCTGDP